MVHPEMGHIRVPHDLAKDPYLGGCLITETAWKAGLRPGNAGPLGQSSSESAPRSPSMGFGSALSGPRNRDWVLTLSPQRIVLGGGVARQSEIFKSIRLDLMALLNGYVRAPEVMRDIDQYVVPPQLGGRAESWAAWCWRSRPTPGLTANS